MSSPWSFNHLPVFSMGLWFW